MMTMIIKPKVTCSPDLRGNFGSVTETFTVGSKSVQVILFLMILILILIMISILFLMILMILMLILIPGMMMHHSADALCHHKFQQIKILGDACHQERERHRNSAGRCGG